MTAPARSGPADSIQEILRGLRNSSTDIIGVALVSAEGFIAAALLPNEVDAEVVAGLAVGLLADAERVSQELLSSEMLQTCVRSRSGFIVLNQVGTDAVLVVLATEHARLGLLLMDIKLRVAELGALI
jgi:predicted regulator of Ras-like GTPase activity (Roadblock/LC7/MglB family)